MRIPVASVRTLTIATSLVAACSRSPAAPPVVSNLPPVIQSVTLGGDRAEADADLKATAVVTDAETPIDRFTYSWSAAPQSGTFLGSGASVTWRAPKGQRTPDLYTLTLTVVEPFTSAGRAQQNTVTSTATVHYNDSPAEVTFLAKDFLEDKFGNYNVGPAEAVSNFSDNCPGKRAEFNDITINRNEFQILSATYAVDSISINPARTAATIAGRCVFEDIKKSTGERETVPGICTLTNVYENFRWLLCNSNFDGTGPEPVKLQRGRAPGQVVGND
jgi:hypothetical protein